MSGYMSMTGEPSGYPKKFQNALEISKWHPGGKDCCGEIDGPWMCTFPSWIKHIEHEAWDNWGIWSGASWDRGHPDFQHVKMNHKWLNKKYTPIVCPQPMALPKAAIIEIDMYGKYAEVPKKPILREFDEWDLFPDAEFKDYDRLPTIEDLDREWRLKRGYDDKTHL